MNTSIKTGSRKGRRNYDIAFKKRLAIAACAPSVSVARLALEHGINANMLHKWRREHLAVGAVDARESHPMEFLAVNIARSGNELAEHQAHALSRQTVISVPKPPVPKPGVIEIKMGAATLRMEGAVDAATLDQVLRHFRP